MDRIGNRYQILTLIGRGGMGKVYQAKDELLDRIVAIKTIYRPPDVQATANPEFSINLMNEARMMARIQHPNVIPIYDLLQENGSLYIVMPLMTGTIAIQRIGERPLMEVIRFFERIADGLDFLHNHQIIHYDLKPANIFIDDDQPYISDFGLAAEISALDENPDSIKGTPLYMAPEIFHGQKATTAIDIFSFGILLFEFICGKHPFKSDNMNLLLRDILESPLPSIGEHRPELSEAVVRDIDAVLTKLTAKNPVERYPSAREAMDHLYRIVYSGQQIIEGKLFISYARRDQEFVYQLADELQRYGVDLWIDRNIEYGTDWDESIDYQLRDCDAMLLIVTPASMQSSYVTYEWSYFKGANKPIFPFMPETPHETVEFHPRLQRMQYIKGTSDIAQNVRHIIEVLSQAIALRKKHQQ